MLIASQETAPARLIQTTHGLSSLLTAADLKNCSEKQIVSYRIGWAYVRGNVVKFHTGSVMNVPAGIAPGSVYEVPDQAVTLDSGVEKIIFFVAEVKFADGSQWKAANKEIKRVGLKRATV